MTNQKAARLSYAYMVAIKPCLRLPVCFTTTKRKGLDYSAMYEELEGFHSIIINLTQNTDNDTLFETVAHELVHAQRAEKNQSMRHDAAFFKELDRVLLRFGLQKTSKEEKKACRALGRAMGNGG